MFNGKQDLVKKEINQTTRVGRKKNFWSAKNWDTAINYVKLYTQNSTFHGVIHIANPPTRHWAESLFWLFVFISFSGAAIWTVFQSYQRYLANPIVITVDKGYRTWNISFPASTFCFVDKLDYGKAKNIVKRKWKVEKGASFEYYMKFLQVLVNSSYYNLGDFEEFKDDRDLLKENLSYLMNEVNFEVMNVRPTLFNDKISYFFKVTLEMGICYSVSSLLAREFAPNENNRKDRNYTRLLPFEPEYCTYLHILCYGMAEKFPRDIIIYVHSPYEVPIAASSHHILYRNYQMELTYNQHEIKSSLHVRSLHPSQRYCYFFDEPREKSVKYYSFNTCIMQCRRKLTMRLCRCVPHFYIAQDGQPVCNVRQLLCIHKNLEEILALSQRRNKTETTCICYQNCEDTSLTLDYQKMSRQRTVVFGQVLTSTRYRWAIETYSKIRFKRDIIFGVEELLISFGGTFCFFLGGSLISGIEFIYFFTLRLLRYMKR